MGLSAWTLFEWLAVIEHELLLFAGIFLLIGTIDEFAVDAAWLWLRLTGRARTPKIEREGLRGAPLRGRAAVFLPAWQEEAVIGSTIAHAIAAWPQAELRIYAGCYRNDEATAAAIRSGSGGDPRVSLVVLEKPGPTTKADCLNRLYEAMEADEHRSGVRFRQVILHDAEDMVDAAALPLMDRALDEVDFVQMPVLPEVQRSSRWIGGHYCDEFAEAHGKSLVVRCAFGAGLPAAGVGCAFSRDMLHRIASDLRASGPFSPDSLTEDYELGLRIRAMRGRSAFLRVRGEDGRLVATRAFFPARIDEAVRQKARWIHGISLQGWDRLGWNGGFVECWMRLRDRRGPFTALVLFVAYVLLGLSCILGLAELTGVGRRWMPDALLFLLLLLNLASFCWRAVARFAFTAREYGWLEGLMAVPRIAVGNIVIIMAGRRAFAAYIKTLAGSPVRWDKTEHHAHPAAPLRAEVRP